MITCKICQHESQEVFSHKLRRKYTIKYFLCNNCNFLQTEHPFWLKEAYEEPINISDTGYVTRNVYLSKKTLTLFYFLFNHTSQFLDYAGGYGILTRLMRDYGLDFLWSDQYTQNIFARGFEFKNEKIEVITCFECFEHFLDPLMELEKMLVVSKNIFFSTTLLSSPLPSKEKWDYYGFEHGQHLSFYSKKTLEVMAHKYNLYLYTNNTNLHLFTAKPISSILYKTLLLLSRLPIDLIIRRMLKSKTTSDSRIFSDFK